MKITRISVASIMLAAAIGNPMFIHAEEKPAKKWKNVAELSVVSSNGNTKASTYAAKDTFNYDWTKTSLELIGAGLSSDSNGQTTAEKYMASEKFTYKLDDRNYTYEKGRWDKDRFAGILNRYDVGAGLGRQFIKTAKNNLIAELGAGYINEERINSGVNDFTSGRVYSKYVRTLSPTANFSQDAEYLENFENSDDFRVNTETALIAAIDAHFSLKASYTWHYVGEPPVGFGRSDTITAISLLASY